MSQRTNRTRRIQQHLDAMPLREAALREAFDDFRMFGELPENERLAQAVVDCAIAGEVRGGVQECDMAHLIRQALQDPVASETKERTLREYLLDHAGYAPPALRLPARLACQVLAAKGHDLTDPATLADAELPGHNGIGMHVLGWPDKLAIAPYEEQARRLFARFAAMREWTPNCGDAWFEEFGEAARQLRIDGVVPDDDRMRDAVLADVEMECLVLHQRGDDVGELMAALDRAAHCEGEKREVAVEDVMRLALARRGEVE